MNLLAVLLAVGLVGGVGGVALLYFRSKTPAPLHARRVLVVAILLLVSVTAGLLPLHNASTNEVISNTDVIFLVDTTYSMNALDGRSSKGDTRLNDVKSDIATLADKLSGSRFGVVTFDSQTNIYLPLTATSTDIHEAAQTLATGTYSESTTDPSVAGGLTSTKQYLDAAAKVDPTRQRVVVLMTDGELTGKKDTKNSVEDAAKKLASSANSAVVIGYGTAAGAKMPLLESNDQGTGLQTLKGDYAYSYTTFGDAISKRDDGFLQSLASDLNGTYIAEQDTSSMVSSLKKARSTAASKQASNPANVALRQNILHVPLALLLVTWILLAEILSLAKVRNLLMRRRTYA